MLAVSGQNCPTKGIYYNIQTTQYVVTSGDHKLKKFQSIGLFLIGCGWSGMLLHITEALLVKEDEQ